MESGTLNGVELSVGDPESFEVSEWLYLASTSVT